VYFYTSIISLQQVTSRLIKTGTEHLDVRLSVCSMMSRLVSSCRSTEGPGTLVYCYFCYICLFQW